MPATILWALSVPKSKSVDVCIGNSACSSRRASVLLAFFINPAAVPNLGEVFSSLVGSAQPRAFRKRSIPKREAFPSTASQASKRFRNVSNAIRHRLGETQQFPNDSVVSVALMSSASRQFLIDLEIDIDLHGESLRVLSERIDRYALSVKTASTSAAFCRTASCGSPACPRSSAPPEARACRCPAARARPLPAA